MVRIPPSSKDRDFKLRVEDVVKESLEEILLKVNGGIPVTMEVIIDSFQNL